MKMMCFSAVTVIFFSCSNRKTMPGEPRVKVIAEASDSAENFFPVTAYLKGEVANIKSTGITPMDHITKGRTKDSAYLKEADYGRVFADFLSPEIDSVRTKNIFSQQKFLDETLNAYTFSYDPLNEKADSFAFRHWDVYIDPETNKVNRIYLLKKTGNKELQLTWRSGKWCRIVTINDKDEIERDEKISWSYDKQ